MLIVPPVTPIHLLPTYEERRARFWETCAIVKDTYGGLPWHVVGIQAAATQAFPEFVQIPYLCAIEGSATILTRCNFRTKRSLLASVDWALGKPE